MDESKRKRKLGTRFLVPICRIRNLLAVAQPGRLISDMSVCNILGFTTGSTTSPFVPFCAFLWLFRQLYERPGSRQTQWSRAFGRV